VAEGSVAELDEDPTQPATSRTRVSS
jgi:hypothetical protein